MLGELIRKEEKWFVKYPDVIEQIEKTIPVDIYSLTNPHLSSYWVLGREVEFQIVFVDNTDGYFDQPFAKIIHDDYNNEDGWNRVNRELCEQDLRGWGNILKWLIENYHPPRRK